MEKTNRFSVTGYRLVALWAFAEAGLGGVLHALHLPVTGLLVGGFAVLCMALLAAYERPGAILPALGIVLAVKFLASPHSPPPAYLAVTFQGVVAWLLFTFVSNFRLAALLLGVCSLVESATQKLLMLLLYFGKPLYNAMGTFFDDVAEKFNYIPEGDGRQIVLYIVIAYLLFHMLVGLYIGYVAGRLPERLRTYDIIETEEGKPSVAKPAKSRLSKWFGRALVLMVPVLLIYFYYRGGSDYLLADILLRLLFVFLLTGPVLQLIITFFLRKRANRYSLEVSGILKSLPQMRGLLFASWKASKEKKGRSFSHFLFLFIASWLFRSTTHLRGEGRAGFR